MGTIYLVRHGQASFGARDYDKLSPRGVEQGRVLGRWFVSCNLSFDACVSGSMQRHQETARACLAAMGRADDGLHCEPGFNEYDHEEMLRRHEPAFADPQSAAQWLQAQQHPQQAFQRVFTEAFGRWLSGSHDAEYRESWPAFRNRCMAALDRLVNAAGRSNRIVVFTSGGPITAITHQLLNTAEDRVSALNAGVINSSVTKLLFQPGRISLSSFNSHAHLEAAGDARLITYR